jgi:hypothetical protein
MSTLMKESLPIFMESAPRGSAGGSHEWWFRVVEIPKPAAVAKLIDRVQALVGIELL